MATLFTLSYFLKYLFRLVEQLSFRDNMFWSSTGILLGDQARDWIGAAMSLLGCSRTPHALGISPATAILNTDYWQSTTIKTLKFCRILAKFQDLCVWFMSTSKCFDFSLNLLIYILFPQTLQDFGLYTSCMKVSSVWFLYCAVRNPFWLNSPGPKNPIRIMQRIAHMVRFWTFEGDWRNNPSVWIPHLKWRVFAVQKCAQNGYREKWWWIATAWWKDENLDTKWKR